jgi:hypothetical protein
LKLFITFEKLAGRRTYFLRICGVVYDTDVKRPNAAIYKKSFCLRYPGHNYKDFQKLYLAPL